MASNRIEERLATLESEVTRLRGEVERLAHPSDWRSAAGMFTGNEFMKQVDEAGRRIREQDRAKAKRAKRKPRLAKR